MSGMFVRSRKSARPWDDASLQGPSSVVTTPAGPAGRQNLLTRRGSGLSDPAKTSPAICSATAPPIGSLLYLGSVGLVAAGIVAVFFGAGFLLLAPPAGGRTSVPATQAASAVIALPPFPGNDDQAAFTESADTAGSSGSLPTSAAGPWLADKNPSHQPAQAGRSVTSVPQDTPAAQTEASPRLSEATVAKLTSQTTSRLSATELDDLLEHGDSLLRTGDVASARLFYERAADAGDGRAALRLGATFDPIFLVRFRGNVQADAASARSWYSRALDLGALEAKGQLNSLETRQGK